MPIWTARSALCRSHVTRPTPAPRRQGCTQRLARNPVPELRLAVLAAEEHGLAIRMQSSTQAARGRGQREPAQDGQGFEHLPEVALGLGEPEQVEELMGTPVIGVIPRGTARSLRQAKGGAA